MQIVHRELINRIIGIYIQLKRFGYIRCNITLSFFIDSAGHRDILCIIRCPQYESAVIVRGHRYELLVIEQPMTSMQLLQNLGQRVYQIKAWGVNDLRQHLINV